MDKHGQRASRKVMAAAVVMTLGVVAPTGAAWAASGATGRAAGSWGKAIEVPGTGALNKGGLAGVNEVSCASRTFCVAAGAFATKTDSQGFVAVERNGRWGKAARVPGLQALNTGQNAKVLSVSCAATGYCAAGGFYSNGRGGGLAQLFVVTERNGRWGKAIEIPGLGALNKGGDAEDVSVSCGSAGNCAAGGSYEDGLQNYQGFVATEQNGRWGKAIEVPGLGALNAGDAAIADVTSVSCASAGNCAAGGNYQDKSERNQGFVVTERNGRWGTAIEVPGLGALNTGATPFNNDATVGTVSCPSAGNCAASGYYSTRGQRFHGFVADERNGRWAKATEVPGLDALSTSGDAGVDSLSCPSAGNCTADGTYTPIRNRTRGFVAAERNGRWGKATEVPGLDALSTGGNAGVDSVSCSHAGNCAAGGFYRDKSGNGQVFVINERNGRWGKVIDVPGLATLNTGQGAEIDSVSCSPAGNCAAGGSYMHAAAPPFFSQTQAFVVSRSS
jgi:hypothetical protein